MEVIKKWSDLKCDTKRKVAAMRSGTVPNRGLNSRLSRDLSQTEKIVLQILEMDDDNQSTCDFGPLGDDDVPDEDEEMDEEDMIGMHSSANGGVGVVSMPPPPPYYSVSGQTHSGNREIYKKDVTCSKKTSVFCKRAASLFIWNMFYDFCETSGIKLHSCFRGFITGSV